MFRFLSVAFCLLVTLFVFCEEVPTSNDADEASESVADSGADNANNNDAENAADDAVSSAAILDKANAAFQWFEALGDDANKRRTQSRRYREHITPLELLRAVILLQQQNETEKTNAAVLLFAMIPRYEISAEEAFALFDELNDKDWKSLSAVDQKIVDKLKDDAATFRRDRLNSAEKIALLDEPLNATALFRAVDVISVAGRPVLTRHYLKKFLENEKFYASPEESAKIVETIGSQRLIRIASDEHFAPYGKTALITLIGEAKKHWQAIGTVEAAMKDFHGFDVDAEAETKIKTGSVEPLTVLWKGEKLSISALIDKLKNCRSDTDADELTAVLLSMRRDSQELLAAVMLSGNPKLAFDAARGLAAAVNSDNTFLLYSFVFDDSVPQAQRDSVVQILTRRNLELPTKGESVKTLFQRGNDYLEKNRVPPSDSDRNVSLWHWNTEKQNVEEVSLPIDSAYRYFAFLYASQTYHLDRETNDVKQLYYTALFESIAYNAGIDAPTDLKTLPVENLSVSFWETFLMLNIQRQHYRAAQIAVTLLGQTGLKSLLQERDGNISPLVLSVGAKDRRLRFAALKTVMSLKADEPFSGSSLVSDALIWFSQADGKRLFVSAHPKISVAKQVGSYYVGLGFKNEVAGTCRDALWCAGQSPDVEFMIIDRLSGDPIMLAAAQNEARTAEIPIAVLEDNANELKPENVSQFRKTMERGDRISPDNPYKNGLVLTYPRITNEKAAAWVLNDLILKTGAEIVPPEIRLDNAKQALRWLKEIIEDAQSGKKKVYHFEDFEAVVFNALRSNARLAEGFELAAVTKSAALQETLFLMAGDKTFSMPLRQKAGAAFEQSIGTFGVLIRGEKVQRLYDR